MLFSHDGGFQNTAGGFQRVYRGVNAFLHDLSGKDGGGIEMAENRCGGRVGQIVRRHVNRLYGGNGTVLGGGNALFQLSELSRQSRLITDGGGHSSEQSGYFRTCLHIAEDVIDKEQNVLILHVAEVFRHGKPRESGSHSGAGRFVHLSEYQSGVFQDA